VSAIEHVAEGDFVTATTGPVTSIDGTVSLADGTVIARKIWTACLGDVLRRYLLDKWVSMIKVNTS
jgi:hypothetical protein